MRRKYRAPEEAKYFPKIDLPGAWGWASVDQLTFVMQYGASAKTDDDPSGVPVFRMGNIVRGELKTDRLKYLPGSISVIATASNTVTATIPVGAAPYALGAFISTTSPPPPAPAPTLGTWGRLRSALMLGGVGYVMIRNRVA